MIDRNTVNPKDYYDKASFRVDCFRKLNWYYHQDLSKYYRFLIPEGQKVLEIGCGTGDLLALLKPEKGVGIDISGNMISQAKKKHPKLKFIKMDAQKINLNEKFDYIVISGTIGDLEDVYIFLYRLQKLVHKNTRIIIDHYNHIWQPFLRLAEAIGLKTPQVYKNWLPTSEIENLFYLTDFEIIKKHNRMLLPIYLPVISNFINEFIAKLPLMKNFCLNRFIVVRSFNKEKKANIYSVSIIVPARNEKGTIEKIINKMPNLGRKTELIFVEGHSTDGTYEEIKQVMKKYKNKEIKLLKQEKGIGKADAIHLGFEKAKGDILIIYDADMSVPIDDINKFYHALISGKGEFISGSRLIYPMEKKSMRFINLLGNIFFGAMFTWLLEHHVTDTLCGTKALWKKDYEKMKKLKEYFGNFDPFGDFELLFTATYMNLKHVEIPVQYKARIYGKSNIRRFSHALLLFKMCWIAFWRLKTI